MLCGLLFSKKLKSINGVKDGFKLIGDRFIRLMVPYYFYTVVSIVLKLFLDEYANNKLSLSVVLGSLVGIQNPNGGLWFLFALFAVSVLAVILCKLPPVAGLVLSIVLYVVNLKIHIAPGFPLIGYVMHYSLFFYLGIVLFDYYDKISKEVNVFVKKNLLLSGTVVAVYLPVAFLLTIVLEKNIDSGSVYNLFITLLNAVVYYLLALIINALAKIKKPFMTVGNYGMDIYLIGYYVQITLRVLLKSMLGAPYTVYSLAMLVFGLILPIPISKYIVRKTKITRLLCLGDYKK